MGNAPMYEKDSGKPIFEPDSGKPIFGVPVDCPCCGEHGEGPCWGCCGEHVQPNAVVTTSGNAWEGRPPPSNYDDCFEFEGTCIFNRCDEGVWGEGTCDWYWDGPTFVSHAAGYEVTTLLWIHYGPGEWSARMRASGGNAHYGGSAANAMKIITGEISCAPDTHQLSAAFDLAGLGEFGCAPYPPTYPDGCTAHVTIG